MKPIARKNLLAVLLSSLAIVIAGCSSYSASVKPSASLAKYQRVWVKTNMDDNHGIAQFICNALRARGIETGAGPLTMMPDNMQAVISYRDDWTWDFKDHMTGLVLSLQDNNIDFPIATARYSGPASLTDTPDDVATKLVTKLFTTPPDRKRE